MKWKRSMLIARPFACTALLALLAISGYMGAMEPQVQAVTVPIVHTALNDHQEEKTDIGKIRTRLDQKREEELVLLDSVIAHADTSARTRSDALEQKTALALAMDAEAKTEAALSCIGIDQSVVICSGGSISVFVPPDAAADEKARTLIIDAAASQSGLEPGEVKIILAKK